MKNHFLLFISLFLFSAQLFAQDDDDSESKWYLGLQLESGYSYRTLSPGSDDPNLLTIINVRNEHEKARAGWAGGIQLGYRLTERLSVESGVSVSQLGEIFADSLIFGMPDPVAPNEIETQYSYNYVDIPAIFRFDLNLADFRVYLFFGPEANIFLSSQSRRKLYYEDRTELEERDARPIPNNDLILSLKQGVGFEYRISSVKIFSRFIMKRNIMPIADADIDQQFFFVGGSIGASVDL